MANRYVFGPDLRPLLEQGRKRIELPQGTRLSPSAAELVRDFGAEVVFIDPAKSEAAKPKEPARAEPKPEEPKQEEPPAAEPVGEGTGPREGRVSEAEIEEILERVLRRLDQARGRAGEPKESQRSETQESTPAPAGPAQDDDLVICRCEEITKGQIREALRNGITTLNGVKRVTRAGMGLCQGQTCQRLVTAILAQELKLSPVEVEPVTARPPTRPVPLDILATG